MPLSNLNKIFRNCHVAYGGSAAWFAGHWSGVCGIHPGTGSGSQTAEAFHAFWASCISRGLIDIGSLLTKMQGLFREQWSSHFDWGADTPISAWAGEPDHVLLNGTALRSVGRSPAVDFWCNKDKVANVRRIERSGTTFWILDRKL